MSEQERKKLLAKKFKRAGELANTINPELFVGLKERNETLSAYLEKADPTADYDRMPFDSFERVLATRGIITRANNELGINASDLQTMRNDEVAKHCIGEIFTRAYRSVAHGGNPFKSREGTRALQSNDAALGTFTNQYAFPSEIQVPRVEAAIPVAELVSRTEGVNADTVKPYEIEDVTEDMRGRVSEGAQISHAKITNKEKEITLTKKGIGIIATYEVLRRVPIDQVAIFVQRVAVKNEAAKVDELLDILVSGDGNAGTAATNYNKTALDTSLGSGDPLSVRAWLSFKMKWENPYMITHILAREAHVLDVQMINTGSANVALIQAGGIFAGQEFTPINKRLRDNVGYGWLSSAPANVIVGFDRNWALKRYFEIGSEIAEVAKWIEDQTERLYMTENDGFELWDSNANKTLTLNA